MLLLSRKKKKKTSTFVIILKFGKYLFHASDDNKCID